MWRSLLFVACIALVQNSIAGAVEHWSRISLSSQPHDGQMFGGDYLLGNGAPNPIVEIPLDAVRGKWVRFSGLVYYALADIRFTLNVWQDASHRSAYDRLSDAQCDQPSFPSRCAVTLWVPNLATGVTAVAWASQEPGLVSDLVVEVLEPQWTDKNTLVAHTVLSQFRRQYYRRHEVDWSSLQRALDLTPDVPIGIDASALFARQVIARLPGNRHSFVVEHAQGAATHRPVLWPACSEVTKGVWQLTLPGTASANMRSMRKYATMAQRCLTGKQKITHWVVDLRANDGGNMYPMLAALAAFLRSGEIFAFRDHRGNPVDRIAISRSGVSSQGKLILSIALALDAMRNVPLTVLIGPQCASSCEAVALALSARSNTLFAGQETAGLTTSNEVFRLNDRYTVFMTTAWMANPCAQIAPGTLRPEVEIADVDSKSVADIIDMPSLQSWFAKDNAIHPVKRQHRCAF